MDWSSFFWGVAAGFVIIGLIAYILTQKVWGDGFHW